MKIKICGIKYEDNANEIISLSPDYLGFIFYSRSKRYMEQTLDPSWLMSLNSVKKVGVFVNESADGILDRIKAYGLDMIQLHGDETPQAVVQIHQRIQQSTFEKTGVIKVFGIDEAFDFNQLNDYKQYCDYFLFDTKTSNYGGSGQQFNWDTLEAYDNDVPIFLSGGIGLDELDHLESLSALNIHAIDMNSKLEIEPGRKDIEKVRLAIEKIRQLQLKNE